MLSEFFFVPKPKLHAPKSALVKTALGEGPLYQVARNGEAAWAMGMYIVQVPPLYSIKYIFLNLVVVVSKSLLQHQDTI